MAETTPTMVETTTEIGDTDYDNFSPNLSPVSDRSNDEKVDLFNDNNSLLGVIVDRSSFDEDDELTTYGRDSASVMRRHPTSLNLPLHQQYDSGLPLGGVLMKNGKVRRKMRWKPRFGRKKSSSNQFSSNASVVSALTNRSSSTSRSSSTTRSFLSHFSRKSANSFHTFHSTETPVATNKANRPQAPHTVMRPNYQDSFDAKPTTVRPKYATIDTEGKFMQRQLGSSQFSVSSSSGFPSTKLDSVMESSPSEEVEVNRSSTYSSSQKDAASSSSMPDPKTNGVAAINVANSSNNSVGATSAISAISKGSATNPPIPSTITSSKATPQQQSKPKRPPLFKRRLRHKKNNSLGNFSIGSLNSNSQQKNVSSPTDTNSTSSLSTAVSLERENSGLPVLRGDEQDRRVHIDIARSLSDSPSKSPKPLGAPIKTVNEDAAKDAAEEGPEENSVSPTVQTSLSESQSGGPSRSQSASSGALTRNSTPSSLQKRISSISKKRSTSSTSISTASPNRMGSSTGGSTSSPPSPVLAPVSTTTQSPAKGKFGGRMSVPCDLDEGAFLEAEHNLRAIHEMAAEHLAHGEYEEAADVFEEILRGQQERYGQDHYRVGTALHNLGIVYLKKRDYEKAIEICQRAVDVRKDSLVPNHPDVAVSLSQLGVAHLESRNYHEALAAFRDALNIRRSYLGPRHLKCSKILNNIGCALYSTEDLPAAKRAFDEALTIQREGLRNIPTMEGSDSNGIQSDTLLLSMASTLCNIGSIRLRWGDFDKANIALEEALLIQQSVLGDEHPIVGSTMESIELVETAQYYAANPLMRTAANCVVESPTDVVTEMFEDITPNDWFANPCGPVIYNRRDYE